MSGYGKRITKHRTRNKRCKPTEPAPQPKPKVRNCVKWDVSTELTEEILRDMGVGLLDDASCDSLHEPLPTPQVMAENIRVPPKAPQVPSHRLAEDHSALVEYNHTPCRPFGGIADDFVLFRRGRSEGPYGEDQFRKMSDEVILHMFKLLPKSVLAKCAQVCKRWKRLVYDESLWRHIDLSRKHLRAEVLQDVVQRGVVVLKLAMSEVSLPAYASNTLMSKGEIQPRFSKLQYLDLSMATIPEESLSQLLSACAQLKKLSLEHCIVNDQICWHIAQNSNLEVLNMSMCQGVRHLLIIASKCQRLQSWNIAWTGMPREALSVLIGNMPSTMEYLNISGCRSTLLDDHIDTLVRQCPNLLELDISDAMLVTGASIDFIANGLRHLKHLHVSRCYNIPPTKYTILADMAALRNLEIYGVLTEVSLHTLKSILRGVELNRSPYSSVARPTTGIRRSSIWGVRIKD